MTDPDQPPRRDPVDDFSLPGHDRDCARAIRNEARLGGRLDTIQVEHLLQIGWRAGRAINEPAVRKAQADAVRGAGHGIAQAVADAPGGCVTAEMLAAMTDRIADAIEGGEQA